MLTFLLLSSLSFHSLCTCLCSSLFSRFFFSSFFFYSFSFPLAFILSLSLIPPICFFQTSATPQTTWSWHHMTGGALSLVTPITSLLSSFSRLSPPLSVYTCLFFTPFPLLFFSSSFFPFHFLSLSFFLSLSPIFHTHISRHRLHHRQHGHGVI